ncbi:hypothetical protein HMPREF1550_02311 [Actinomyces sp. oral taxon 877 str. F0543]|nr:hypothetical protein HMPREF1550_02311 [Actinomyces sp. oral taxon 877 str. F0543]
MSTSIIFRCANSSKSLGLLSIFLLMRTVIICTYITGSSHLRV